MKYVCTRSSRISLAIAAISFAIAGLPPLAHASKENPKVIERWGGDLGMWQVSARYHPVIPGVMSGVDRTIDSGDPLTDYFAHMPLRTIVIKVLKCRPGNAMEAVFLQRLEGIFPKQQKRDSE